MRVTHKQLLQLRRLLMDNPKISVVKVAYALARNQIKIKPVLDAFFGVQKPSEEYQKYNDARLELCKRLAKKDEKDRPRTKLTRIKGPLGLETTEVFDFEDPEAANKALEELQNREEFKQIFEDHTAKEEEIMKLLDESVDIDLYTLSVSDIPDGTFKMSDVLLLTEIGVLVD